MHDGIGRKLAAAVAEDVHQARSGPRRVVRVGKDECPAAAQGIQLLAHLVDGAEPEDDPGR